MTLSRNLNPTEQAMKDLLSYEMTAKQARHLLSQKLGRDVPTGTVSGCLANLRNWGLITSRRKRTPARNASRMLYRAVDYGVGK